MVYKLKKEIGKLIGIVYIIIYQNGNDNFKQVVGKGIGKKGIYIRDFQV